MLLGLLWCCYDLCVTDEEIQMSGAPLTCPANLVRLILFLLSTVAFCNFSISRPLENEFLKVSLSLPARVNLQRDRDDPR